MSYLEIFCDDKNVIHEEEAEMWSAEEELVWWTNILQEDLGLLRAVAASRVRTTRRVALALEHSLRGTALYVSGRVEHLLGEVLMEPPEMYPTYSSWKTLHHWMKELKEYDNGEAVWTPDDGSLVTRWQPKPWVEQRIDMTLRRHERMAAVGLWDGKQSKKTVATILAQVGVPVADGYARVKDRFEKRASKLYESIGENYFEKELP